MRFRFEYYGYGHGNLQWKMKQEWIKEILKNIADHIEGAVKIRNSIFVIWPSSMDFTLSAAA